MPPKEDRTIATDNIHNNMVKIGCVVSEISK